MTHRGGWKHKHGMNWIRLDLRMAIYLRDRFDCVWCRQVFPVDRTGRGLSLDHLDPKGGHTPDNLVTSCPECNSLRQDLPLRVWLKGRPEMRNRMRRAVRRTVERTHGKALVRYRRGEISSFELDFLLGVA